MRLPRWKQRRYPDERPGLVLQWVVLLLVLAGCSKVGIALVKFLTQFAEEG